MTTKIGEEPLSLNYTIITSSIEEAMVKHANPKIMTEQVFANFNQIVSERVVLWLEHLDARKNRVDL